MQLAPQSPVLLQALAREITADMQRGAPSAQPSLNYQAAAPASTDCFGGIPPSGSSSSAPLASLQLLAEAVGSQAPSTEFDTDASHKGWRWRPVTGSAKKTPRRRGFRCDFCGATSTPERRKGPSGSRTLCNRCGLAWAKQVRTEAAHIHEHMNVSCLLN